MIVFFILFVILRFVHPSEKYMFRTQYYAQLIIKYWALYTIFIISCFVTNNVSHYCVIAKMSKIEWEIQLNRRHGIKHNDKIIFFAHGESIAMNYRIAIIHSELVKIIG